LRPWLEVAAVLVLCGCGGDGSSLATTPASMLPVTAAPTTSASSSTTSAPSTSEATPPTTAGPTIPAPTTVACPTLTDTDVTSEGFPGRLSGLVGADVRAGADACHERVVFELQGTGEFPGWRVRYQEPPVIDDPRGEPVEVAGSAFIVVTIESWMTNMDGEGYVGPTRITPTNVSHIKELVLLGNFESVTTWAIGVDQQRAFAVSTLASPPRLVIDLATS
jgi:hypothetical protein